MRLLRPHLTAFMRNAAARRRLADLVSAVDSGRESRGFLLVGPDLRIEHASRAARILLYEWFGNDRARLPKRVEEWLRSDSTDVPLEERVEGKRLTVEAPSRGALVLTEESVPPSSLTRRELAILRRAAAGRTTKQIARELWVTPATVSKHFEHIYRKLGVTGRTAALAALGATDLTRDRTQG